MSKSRQARCAECRARPPRPCPLRPACPPRGGGPAVFSVAETPAETERDAREREAVQRQLDEVFK